jgi:hypothetical protein
MALTAAPVPGNTIMASWGTEIRNRTVQMFASQAELDAWAPAPGALAYRSDQRRYYTRSTTAWLPFSVTHGGTYVGTTDANGRVLVPHGLLVSPRSAIVTPSMDNLQFKIAQIKAVSATNIDVWCSLANGLALQNSAISLYYMVVV